MNIDVEFYFIFFFNDTATTEIYTLSLHDALPIWVGRPGKRFPENQWCASLSRVRRCARHAFASTSGPARESAFQSRSEEHTSELQSRQYLVCRLLLEKKNKVLDNKESMNNHAV